MLGMGREKVGPFLLAVIVAVNIAFLSKWPDDIDDGTIDVLVWAWRLTTVAGLAYGGGGL